MDRDQLRAASAPKAIKASLRKQGAALKAAGEHHDHAGLASVRTATYQGHEIVVRTTYEITVDGEPFDVAITVDNAGRVHYHGLPTRDFASVIALVEKAIDAFPDDFTAIQGHGHSGGGHGGHG